MRRGAFAAILSLLSASHAWQLARPSLNQLKARGRPPLQPDPVALEEAMPYALLPKAAPYTLIAPVERIDRQTAAIARLIFSDLKRCLEQLTCVESEACDVSSRFDEVSDKATKYVASRRPLVEWAASRWLSARLGHRLEPQLRSSAPSLSAALAPIQPRRLCREAILVAPCAILSAGLSILLLWMYSLWPKLIAPTRRRMRRQHMLVNLASAYERLIF